MINSGENNMFYAHDYSIKMRKFKDCFLAVTVPSANANTPDV